MQSKEARNGVRLEKHNDMMNVSITSRYYVVVFDLWSCNFDVYGVS